MRAGCWLLLAPLALAGCKQEPPLLGEAGRNRPLPAARPLEPGGDVKTVLLPSPGKPIVTFRIAFLSGSVDDPPGKEGLTALTARTMIRGTRSLTHAQLAATLFPMAAELDVQVGKEMTVFLARVHRDHLERFVPILLDILLRPRWDPGELDRMRRRAIADIERRLRGHDEENLAKEALQGLLYAGHPYGHYIGGTVRALRRITLADLQRQARQVFTRARLLVGLAGGATEALAQRLRSGLANLPKGVAGRKPLQRPRPSRTRVLLIEKDTPSTAISLGHTLRLNRSQPDFYPAFVGNGAFGEHRQSGGRLFEQLRTRRGLNYGDYSYLEHFVQDGWGTYPLPNVPRRQQYFSIWIRPVAHRHRVFALRAALYELDRLLREGISPEELGETRGFLQGYSRMWEQTDSRRLGFALDDQFYGSAPFLATLRETLPSLTVEQVNAALRRHLDPKRLRMVLVTKGAARLRDELLAGRPSPIEYPTPKAPAVLAADRKIAAFPLGLKPGEVKVVRASELFEK